MTPGNGPSYTRHLPFIGPYAALEYFQQRFENGEIKEAAFNTAVEAIEKDLAEMEKPRNFMRPDRKKFEELRDGVTSSLQFVQANKLAASPGLTRRYSHMYYDATTLVEAYQTARKDTARKRKARRDADEQHKRHNAVYSVPVGLASMVSGAAEYVTIKVPVSTDQLLGDATVVTDPDTDLQPVLRDINAQQRSVMKTFGPCVYYTPFQTKDEKKRVNERVTELAHMLDESTSRRVFKGDIWLVMPQEAYRKLLTLRVVDRQLQQIDLIDDGAQNSSQMSEMDE